MSFRVTDPAVQTSVTTVQTIKDELGGLVAGKSDASITRALNRITSEFASYLGIPAAPDGSRNIGLETIEETLWQSPWLRGDRGYEIVLSRKPVTEVTSVVVAGTTIDVAGYNSEGASGILSRIPTLTYQSLAVDRTSRTVITYDAGWTLPTDDPDATFTMPAEIEEAAIIMFQVMLSGRSLPPNVKTQWVTDIERLEFWVGQIGENGSLPPAVTAKLDPYRYEPI